MTVKPAPMLTGSIPNIFGAALPPDEQARVDRYTCELTDKLEQEALQYMNEVEGVGGMEEAIRTEWLDRRFEEEAIKRQKEVDNHDKLVVGVNLFTTEEEKTTPLWVHLIPEHSARDQIEGVRKLKMSRDKRKLNEAIKKLRDAAAEGRNTIPAMIEATQAMATTGELLGTVREVIGYS